MAPLDVEALRGVLARIDGAASDLMRAERVAQKDVTVSYDADVCFVGQSYSLEVPLDPARPNLAERLYEDFLAAHDRVYGHAVRVPAKLVAVRTIHQAGGSEAIEEMRFEPSGEPPDLGTREIRVAGHAGPVAARVLDRDAMPVGVHVRRPGAGAAARHHHAGRAGMVRRGRCRRHDHPDAHLSEAVPQ